MKRIKITQGQFAIVDNKNYEWLNQWKWNAHWYKHTQSYYAVRNSKYVDGKRYLIYMHREILDLKKGDKKQADHINHNTLDNRNLNLRIVTHQQNHWNQRNTKGYYWCKRWKKYVARIKLNGRDMYLGGFDAPEEARKAYLEAKERYHVI